MTSREFDLLVKMIDGAELRVRSDIAGVHTRLDRLNGRVDKHDEDLRRLHGDCPLLHGEDGVLLPRRRVTDQPGTGEAWIGSFTKREVKLIALGLSVITAMAQAGWWIGLQILHLIQPMLKSRP